MRTRGARRADGRFDRLRGHRIALRINDDLLRKSEVDRFHASRAGPPLPEIFRQQTKFVHKVRVSEVHPNRILPLQPRQSSEHGADVLRVGEIHFTYLFPSTGVRQFNLLHEINEESHALFAVVDRSGLVKTADHWKMEAGL